MYSHQEWTRALYWANLSDSKLILMSLTEHRFRKDGNMKLGKVQDRSRKLRPPWHQEKTKNQRHSFSCFHTKAARLKTVYVLFFFLYLLIYTAAGVADCREGDRFRRLFPPFPELVSHELRRGDVWVWTSKEETQYTAIVENVHKRTHTQKKGSDSRKVEELRRRRSIKNRHIR